MKTLEILSFSLLILASSSSIAFASLGDNINSIERDRQFLQGSKRVLSQNGYQVEEIDSDGVTVREYVSSDGTVFAVAWDGAGQPDLARLFGRFYHEYRSAEPRTHLRHTGRRIESQNIVVEKSGHMRAIRGRAYVTKLIPPGVSLSEIQ